MEVAMPDSTRKRRPRKDADRPVGQPGVDPSPCRVAATCAGTMPHARSNRSMRSTSSGSRRKSNTCKSSRMWPASVVPVRGTKLTSTANRKTIWPMVRP